MRHRVAGKKLNRDTKHRRALYKNLITSLITHGQITTTEAKAKAIKSQVDKLITKAKKNTLHHRRQIHSVLHHRRLVNKLVADVAPKTRRDSGYTRTVRLGRRSGDDAMMVRLEFVDSIAPGTLPDKETKKKTAKKSTSAPKSSPSVQERSAQNTNPTARSTKKKSSSK